MAAQGQDAVVLVERRKSKRADVDWEAFGLIPENENALKCRILDISDTGAKLSLTGVRNLPEYFKMFVPNTKALLECETIWQAEGEAGVKFRTKERL